MRKRVDSEHCPPAFLQIVLNSSVVPHCQVQRSQETNCSTVHLYTFSDTVLSY
jgi:hypothetical protein